MNSPGKQYVELKSIRKNTRLVGCLFPSKYGFSPYQGCAHACKYCDGRSERYYLSGDFETDIAVRRNAPELLQAQIPTWRERGIISIGSGVSDPYQPIEEQEQLMTAIAKILKDSSLAVSIMTKSTLFLRDLPVWKKIQQNCGVMVMISLVHSEDRHREIFEPGASPVAERLQMIKVLKQAGLSVGVLAMPILPFLGDNRSAMEVLFSSLKTAGADFIIPGALTLRPGRQKEEYLTTVAQHFPALLQSTQKLFASDRPSGVPAVNYQREFSQKTQALLSEIAIPDQVPHRVYKHALPAYDEIWVLLNHMQQIYARRNVNTAPLKSACQRYGQWLLEEKTNFNRRRKLSGQWLSERFQDMVQSDEIDRVLDNSKLTAFIRQITLEGAVLDYCSLKLESSP